MRLAPCSWRQDQERLRACILKEATVDLIAASLTAGHPTLGAPKLKRMKGGPEAAQDRDRSNRKYKRRKWERESVVIDYARHSLPKALQRDDIAWLKPKGAKPTKAEIAKAIIALLDDIAEKFGQEDE